MVNWVSSCLFFPFSRAPATYIFTAPTYTTTTNIPETYALNAEFQHFIVTFNKIPYFGDTTERGDMGWKQVQIIEGDSRNSSNDLRYLNFENE
jgi:hypothetical protein